MHKLLYNINYDNVFRSIYLTEYIVSEKLMNALHVINN